MKIVPDTSAIIAGKLLEVLDSVYKSKKPTIVIPEIVLAELENQANKGNEKGFRGLDVIKELREREKKGTLKIEYVGERPKPEEIKMAKSGALDALIREHAKKEGAILLTTDIVQARVAEAKGIACEYIEVEPEKLLIEKFFDSETMSVHLKAGCTPKAKKGKPGDVHLQPIGEEVSEEEIGRYVENIIQHARKSGRTEMRMNGATIIQLGQYRIAITREPFSDATEITAVQPIVKLGLKDYKLNKNVMARIGMAEGIIVSGPPGSGKSTFVQALAEHYLQQKKIVKTIERPRDLQVSKEITQYTALEGSLDKTGDVLLLVRPDFTIFDEMRRTNDFVAYSDMRLAGVGMVGVVHAMKPIDAVQRLIGRVELGTIPQLVDTVIHIEGGTISEIFELVFTVKVPNGMFEQDLARPVIEVNDFNTRESKYEIYSYGEEVVVMPVKTFKKGGVHEMIEKSIGDMIRGFSRNYHVELVSDNAAEVMVPESVVPQLIGKDGKTVSELEKKLGISIRVKPMEISNREKAVNFDVQKTKNSIMIFVDPKHTGSLANVYWRGLLFSARVGKKGRISVRRDSDIGKVLAKREVEVRIQLD